MITPDYPPRYTGGCAFSCQLLVEGLRSRGVHTDVWVFNGDPSPGVSGEMGDTLFFRTSPTLGGLNRLAYGELRRRAPDCDIIHVYNTQQLPAAVKYGKKMNKRVTATLNNLAPVCTNPSMYVEGECATCRPLDSLACAVRRPGPLWRRMLMPYHWVQFIWLHRLSRSANGYIALSESTRQCYLDAGYDPQLIKLIPNMFDPGLCTGPSRPTNAGHNKVILYVGRLEAEKGLQVLIRAFALLNEGSVLYIVGKGGYEQQLKKLVDELGLEGKVIFTGFMEKEEIGRYYAMADIFVHPALWPEPFPRTILEALSHGLPMLVSDSGSSATILGEAALSFGNGDHSDLAKKLQLLLDDDELCQITARAGREVLGRYHPDTVMSQIMEFYGSLPS
ncbi:MAG TPA: glycosyltransferase family 4 protein [Methanomassiliicoccales archaeon]|nr:glycosyltransferase family 4 protein [Methanomassiliicoccales archaeon]HPR98459.1 glycosyltransferase family 4 protein [Methanomassiliicoccales archaeon]